MEDVTKKKKPSKRKKSNSLFRRYFRFTIGMVTVVLLVLFVLFSLFLSRNWIFDRENTLAANVVSITNTLESISEDALKGGDVFENVKLIGNMLYLQSDSTSADIFVLDSNGKMLFCKEMMDEDMNVRKKTVCATHTNFSVPEDVLLKAQKSVYQDIVSVPSISPDKQILVGNAIHINHQVVGYIFADMDYNSFLMNYLLQNSRLFFGAAVIALMLVAFLSYLNTYRLIQPLEEMSRLTKMYAKGDFSERIHLRSRDELATLAESLNEMADALSILDESRRSFVSNVSHELKTPMTTISGFVDGILDGTIPPEKQRKYLKIVSKDVKRLAKLVVTMLSLSKIEAGEEELHYTEVDMNQMLFDALLNFETAIERNEYQIKGFDSMPSVHVMADEDLLFQVLYNLFDNAVKFTNPGGTIRVKMRADEAHVTVQISNTGTGIPEDELKRVFERFYKMDKSRSEHVKGVGLGLNLVKSIVEYHGGEVNAASMPNKVTAFSFWIPNRPDQTLTE